MLLLMLLFALFTRLPSGASREAWFLALLFQFNPFFLFISGASS